jgi:ABC-type Fe3+-siderophore transport system permease subunit
VREAERLAAARSPQFAVGGLLALAGDACMQALLPSGKIPLADPYILGISGVRCRRRARPAMLRPAPAALVTPAALRSAALAYRRLLGPFALARNAGAERVARGRRRGSS